MRAAALANPDHMRTSGLVTSAELRTVLAPLTDKLIDDTLVDSMVRELATYKLHSATINWSNQKIDAKMDSIINHWKHAHMVPSWQKFAHLCYLLQVSSASFLALGTQPGYLKKN